MASRRTHTHADTEEAIDGAGLDDLVNYGLLVVDAIDAYVGRLRTPAQVTRA
jgi:hypothetical protein